MKQNKVINFILEVSQVLFVFLGVYSALMCTALSLSLSLNRMMATVVLLIATFLFYGLFTVLETFHNGKLYGLLGIFVFAIVVVIRFRAELQKGAVTIVNTYLKALMSYTQTNFSLLSGKSFSGITASVEYCTSFVVIFVGILLIAIISSCFYRRRRAIVYVACTFLFFIAPMTVGSFGYFSNVITYIYVTVIVIATRFLRSDATDKRLRQKVSLIMMTVGLVLGTISFVIVTPTRYENHQSTIVEMKNSALALAKWNHEDVMTWIRQRFSGDALEYGKIGKKNSVTRNGKMLMKMSGDVEDSHGLYFRAYVGSSFMENRWRQIDDEEGKYEEEQGYLSQDGLSLDGWQLSLRNQIGDEQRSGNTNLWNTGKVTIRNFGFGYGNYVMPYYPTTAFAMDGGRTVVTNPGIEYEVEYYPAFSNELRMEVAKNQYRLADNDYWLSSQGNRNRLYNFAQSFYLTIPEEENGVVEDFKKYLTSQDNVLERYNQGTASLYDIIEETRNYIMKDTEYTLAPGKTPSDEDAVVYFLTKNKKGYCCHYATAAAMLLRGIGIPTRYAEGIYLSKEQLTKMDKKKEISVTDKDLHAWVEVYQQNFGFVPIEFTPGRGEEEADASPMRNNNDGNGGQGGSGENGGKGSISVATPTPKPEEDMTFENKQTENYNHDVENSEVESQDESSEGGAPQEDNPDSGEGGFHGWLSILLGIIGVLAFAGIVAEGQRRVRIALFKNRVKGSRTGQQIRHYYHHYVHAFEADGIKYKGQTMADYAGEIVATYEADEIEVAYFVAMTFCASFSPSDFDKSQMAEFHKASKMLRRKIYEKQKWYRKLYYMYILCL